MAHRLIHLAIYQGGVCAEETPADLTLLWNFGPEAELRTEDETFALRRDDVVSLRPQQRYSLRTGEGPVAAVALDGAQLRACLGGRRLAIRCNSAREVSDNYAISRRNWASSITSWPFCWPTVLAWTCPASPAPGPSSSPAIWRTTAGRS